MVQEGGANRKYLCKYSREDNDELHRTVYIEENVLQEAMADFILVGLKLKISQKTEEKKSSRENTGGKRKTPSQRRKCSLIFMRLMRRERLIKTLF